MESLIQAIEELWYHKLRTFLTLLGMIFGVGAVISMLSIGEGAKREALELIDSMGLRNVLVKAKTYDTKELAEIRERSAGLTLKDVQAGLETLPFVESFSAFKEISTYALFSQDKSAEAKVLGVTSKYLDMSHLEVETGRLLTEWDEQHFSQVCVLGSFIAKQLFPTRDPLGQTVKVNQHWLRIIGVLKERHYSKDEFQGIKLGGEQNCIYLPLQTALKKFDFPNHSNELDEFRFELEKGIDPEQAAITLSHLLDVRHGGMDDFELIIPAALLNQQKKTQRIFTIVMACVAGISLLVGGIGIMNIMLATVLERTREIGLRRAVGATRTDIVRQFLIESFTISAVGGLLGVVLGFVLSQIIAAFAQWQVAWTPMPIILSLGVCSLVGLIFGIYPAITASKLDPIVALQHE